MNKNEQGQNERCQLEIEKSSNEILFVDESTCSATHAFLFENVISINND